MREIMKVVRFDFLTAKPVAFTGFIFTVLLLSGLGMFYSPIIIVYTEFLAIVLVMPLSSAADKGGFNRLYGMLPVKRKNITRARFLYIFIVSFAIELLDSAIIAIARAVRLYRVLPNQNSEMMQMVKESFADIRLTLLILFGMFILVCLLSLYMEMTGQIFGRENEFKIIIVTIGILALIAFAFVVLSERGIIPLIKVPDLPDSTGGLILLGAFMNALMLGIGALFGEITAGVLEKREL